MTVIFHTFVLTVLDDVKNRGPAELISMQLWETWCRCCIAAFAGVSARYFDNNEWIIFDCGPFCFEVGSCSICRCTLRFYDFDCMLAIVICKLIIGGTFLLYLIAFILYFSDCIICYILFLYSLIYNFIILYMSENHWFHVFDGLC